MPGRKYTSGSIYRYGFNGKENDREIEGAGNQYDYGDRIYNPSIGRWLSIDRLQKKFPNESNYGFVSGNPIIYNDPDGRDKIIKIYSVDKNGVKSLVTEKVVEKGVFDEGQGEDGFFYRQDIINELTINSDGRTSQSTSYRNRELYSFQWQRSLANTRSSIANFLVSNSEGSGSYQEAGYSFSGGKGSTLEFKDKTGNYLGNIDLGTLFSFFDAAGLNAEGVETLFEKFADKGTLEKIALFGEKIKTLMESGKTIGESIEKAKEYFDKKEEEAKSTPSMSNGNTKDGDIKTIKTTTQSQTKTKATTGKERKSEPDSISVWLYDGPNDSTQNMRKIANPKSKKKGG